MDRCQALRDNGQRCRKQVTTQYHEYFGDRETELGRKCQWVVVKLCDEHGTAPPEKRKKGGKRG